MGVAAFSYNLCPGLFDAGMPMLSTQELGWTVSEYANVKAMGSMAGGIFGMLLGGFLLDRFGKMLVMRWLLAGFITAHLGMSMLGAYWDQRWLVTLYVVAHQFGDTMITISVFSVAMGLCWKRVAATQFTLYMTISNLGLSTGSAILGLVKSAGGYWCVMAGIAGFALLMLALLRFADLARHGQRIVAMDQPTPAGLTPVQAPVTS
jgi:PAT family beta-lactamase induction signal transducer AmpG